VSRRIRQSPPAGFLAIAAWHGFDTAVGGSSTHALHRVDLRTGMILIIPHMP
jgi:hypothetical protein